MEPGARSTGPSDGNQATNDRFQPADDAPGTSLSDAGRRTDLPHDVVRAARLGGAVATAVFLSVLINWSWHLQPARYTSDFYDVQARQLFHGHLSVPLDRIGLEAFAHGDDYHLYFGIFPAVLRMPLLLFTDRFDGRLTQVSMALAFAVLSVALRGLCGHARRAVRGDWTLRPSDMADRMVFGFVPIVVAAGTPVLFLASVPAVYHEAILWGLAASLYAFHRLLIVMARPSTRSIVVFAAAATVAMGSRAALGLAPCAAAGLLASVAAAAGHRRVAVDRAAGSWRTRVDGLAERLGATTLSTGLAVALMAAAVIPFASHVVVNEARFGTALSPPYASQVWTEMSAERRAALAANDGSLFNVGYVPSTALAYLRPDGVDLSRQFPYVWFDPPATVVGDVVFDTRDRTASITAISPALVLAGVIGAAAIAGAFRRRQRLGQFALFAAAGIASTLGVLTIGFIAQRYEGDLLLPGALTAIPGLFVLAELLTKRSVRVRRLAIGAAGLLVAMGVWANVSIALLYQRLYIPVRDADRHAFIELQVRLDRFIPGSIPYRAAAQPPTAIAPAGTLHVTGDCESLWWSDGTIWIAVEPLDSGTTPLCHRLRDR